MGLEIEDQQYVVRLFPHVHPLTSNRRQVTDHLVSNRQRTDPQKIEVQQRRNALAKRIKVWRVAQMVYMPQASLYLPDESDSKDSEDTQGLDTSKPETWPLFLPSDIPSEDRPSCYKGVIETERVLRLAQLQDGLVGIRLSRRALRNLRLYFKTNIAGEGKKTQTKSRAIEANASNRNKRAVWRYRAAYRALLELDPSGDWTSEYHEFRDQDNRGPLKELGERGTGDGRYVPSWIWISPSATALPRAGSAAEQQEINETARHEWMTCRARADRWIEEEALLQEEMRRVVTYLAWKHRAWSAKVGVRGGSCTPDVQRGIDAYARKQANVHREIAISFAGQWLPYFDACGLEAKWVEGFPWISEARSLGTKLPKWFQPHEEDTPCDTPQTPTTTGSSPPSDAEGSGVPQTHPDTRNTQNEDPDYEREGERELPDTCYEGSDDEEDCYPDGYHEGYDEGFESESYGGGGTDGVETDDEFGFEYDDNYMS